MYRNNYLSGRIEQELVDQKIPYEILGSFKFIEREEIKDTLAFLRTILYQDNISLLRILGLQEKIGARTIEKIEQNSESEKVSIYHYLNNANDFDLENLTTGQAEKIRNVVNKINKQKEQLSNKVSLADFINNILTEFNY